MARVAFAVALAAVVLTGFTLASDSDSGGGDIRTVVIDIEHSTFVPEVLHVTAGETVRFVIRNGDPIDHEFILGDRRLQNIHELGTEAHHGARPGETSIAALGTGETTYTFGGPGALIFACHLPTHYEYGMKGLVQIDEPLVSARGTR